MRKCMEIVSLFRHDYEGMKLLIGNEHSKKLMNFFINFKTTKLLETVLTKMLEIFTAINFALTFIHNSI